MIKFFRRSFMDVTFRSGDTLWHYSQLFYIPLVLIIDSNRGLDQDAIPVGTMVKIPGFTTIQYTIEQGDKSEAKRS